MGRKELLPLHKQPSAYSAMDTDKWVAPSIHSFMSSLHGCRQAPALPSVVGLFLLDLPLHSHRTGRSNTRVAAHFVGVFVGSHISSPSCTSTEFHVRGSVPFPAATNTEGFSYTINTMPQHKTISKSKSLKCRLKIWTHRCHDTLLRTARLTLTSSVTRPASIKFASLTRVLRCTRNWDGMYCATRPSCRLPSASVLLENGDAFPP